MRAVLMLMGDVDADERWCRARRSCQQLAVMPRWRRVVRESAVGSLVGREAATIRQRSMDGWMDRGFDQRRAAAAFCFFFLLLLELALPAGCDGFLSSRPSCAIKASTSSSALDFFLPPRCGAVEETLVDSLVDADGAVADADADGVVEASVAAVVLAAMEGGVGSGSGCVSLESGASSTSSEPNLFSLAWKSASLLGIVLLSHARRERASDTHTSSSCSFVRSLVDAGFTRTPCEEWEMAAMWRPRATTGRLGC